MQVCLAMYMIVAWRVLYVLMLGRECPHFSCEAVLSQAEWKSVYVMANGTALPKKPPTLAVMIPLIAGMGGYLNRTGDGPPGPQTMWIGMQRMRDFAIAWTTLAPRKRKDVCNDQGVALGFGLPVHRTEYKSGIRVPPGYLYY